MRFLEKVALAALIIMAWRDDRQQELCDTQPKTEKKSGNAASKYNMRNCILCGNAFAAKNLLTHEPPGSNLVCGQCKDKPLTQSA